MRLLKRLSAAILVLAMWALIVIVAIIGFMFAAEAVAFIKESL
jgi:hypothetical protein